MNTLNHAPNTAADQTKSTVPRTICAYPKEIHVVPKTSHTAHTTTNVLKRNTAAPITLTLTKSSVNCSMNAETSATVVLRELQPASAQVERSELTMLVTLHKSAVINSGAKVADVLLMNSLAAIVMDTMLETRA